MIEKTELADMFRPPVNRAMQVLDRSFFEKFVPCSVAKIGDRKQITKFRNELSQDILKLDRMQPIRSLEGPQGGEVKAFLLRPEVNPDGDEIHSKNREPLDAYPRIRYFHMESTAFRPRQVEPNRRHAL